MDVVSEVCTRFHTMAAHKRIELVCNLIRMCMPLELRFFGTCLEDIAKKDFFYLRENENKANDVSVLQSLKDIYDDVTRSRLNIYLSLMNSSNAPCSGVLFKTLACFDPHRPNMSKNFMDEVLLLLTLAANHPSFTFNQSQVLQEKVNILNKRYREQFMMEEPPLAQAAAGAPTNQKQKAKQTNQVIHDIALAGAQLRAADRKYEFHVKVSWSDGESTDIFTTYQELSNFHSELVRLFPKESGAHKQDRLIPYFPKESHPSTAMEEQIQMYIRKLSSLPERILHSSEISSMLRTLWSKFFVQHRSQAIPSQPKNAQGGKQISKPGVPIGPVRHNHKSVSMEALTISPSHSPRVSPSPRQSSAGFTPSPHQSPSVSPGSVSLKEEVERSNWLKEMRLHKYEGQLSKYSREELMQLTDQELEEEGLTVGARKKLRHQLNRQMLAPRFYRENGVAGDASEVIEYADSMHSDSPASPAPSWHSSPGANPANHLHPNMMQGLLAGRSLESTPASSEYSSPPASPGPRGPSQQQEENITDDENHEAAAGQENISGPMAALSVNPHEGPRIVPGTMLPPGSAVMSRGPRDVLPGTPFMLPGVPNASFLFNPITGAAGGMEIKPGDALHQYMSGQRLPHPAAAYQVYHPQMMMSTGRPPVPPQAMNPHTAIRFPMKPPNSGPPPPTTMEAMRIPVPNQQPAAVPMPNPNQPAAVIENGPVFKNTDCVNPVPVPAAPTQGGCVSQNATSNASGLSFMNCNPVAVEQTAQNRPTSLCLSQDDCASSTDSVGNVSLDSDVALSVQPACTSGAVAMPNVASSVVSSTSPAIPQDSVTYMVPPGTVVQTSSTEYRNPPLPPRPSPHNFNTPPPQIPVEFPNPPPVMRDYQTPPPAVSGFLTPPTPSGQAYGGASPQPVVSGAVPPPVPTSGMPGVMGAHPPASTPTPPTGPCLPSGCTACGCVCASGAHTVTTPAAAAPAPHYFPQAWPNFFYQVPPHAMHSILPTSNGMHPALQTLPAFLQAQAAQPPNGLTPEHVVYQSAAAAAAAHMAAAAAHPPGIPAGPASGLLAYPVPGMLPVSTPSGPGSNGSSSSSSTASSASSKHKNGGSNSNIPPTGPPINSAPNTNHMNSMHTNYSTVSMCCNCGGSGHGLSECKEPSFDHSTTGGQYQLNITPSRSGAPEAE